LRIQCQNFTHFLPGDSGNGFFVYVNGRAYLKGIVSASITNPNSNKCDKVPYALFTDVLKFIDWIDNQETRVASKCGVMTRSAGLAQGGSVSTLEQFPWQVSIFRKLKKFILFKTFQRSGSGSLITTKHVLAAAQSVSRFKEEYLKVATCEQLKLFFGSLKANEATTSGSIEIDGDGIARVVVHPNAMPKSANIAVITLKSDIKPSSFISPVCLWRGNSHEIASKPTYAVGYGDDESCKASGVKKHIRMTIKSEAYCKNFNSQGEFFCAESDEAGTACEYDEPLYTKLNGVWFVRGIMNSLVNAEHSECSTILYEDISQFGEWIVAKSD